MKMIRMTCRDLRDDDKIAILIKLVRGFRGLGNMMILGGAVNTPVNQHVTDKKTLMLP
jgi:hypothetical protein